MDLRIQIRDENDEVLRELTVYQDGSDSEGADTIAEMIAAEFDVEGENEDDDWPLELHV